MHKQTVSVPVGVDTVHFAARRALFLLKLRNDQMGGDGPRSACERRDRQRCSISGRIANGQDGVDGRCFHDRHADDLRGAGCAVF